MSRSAQLGTDVSGDDGDCHSVVSELRECVRLQGRRETHRRQR
jgi:hypothetical protein